MKLNLSIHNKLHIEEATKILFGSFSREVFRCSLRTCSDHGTNFSMRCVVKRKEMEELVSEFFNNNPFNAKERVMYKNEDDDKLKVLSFHKPPCPRKLFFFGCKQNKFL